MVHLELLCSALMLSVSDRPESKDIYSLAVMSSMEKFAHETNLFQFWRAFVLMKNRGCVVFKQDSY